jgi:hypothetical protein
VRPLVGHVGDVDAAVVLFREDVEMRLSAISTIATIPDATLSPQADVADTSVALSLRWKFMATHRKMPEGLGACPVVSPPSRRRGWGTGSRK